MSQTYTYSLSINFPNGIIIAQLMNEIQAAIPTPLLCGVYGDGDVISIVFASAIPNKTILDNVVANHNTIPITNTTPYILNNVLTTNINNQQYKYFGDQKFEIVISQNTQCHYSSISAAIAANNTPNNVFIVYPGIYIENNPLVLPSGTTLISSGSVATTTIVAQNSTADLLVMGSNCKVFGITFEGAYGTGSRGVYFDGSLSGGSGTFSNLQECYVIDCDIGIECNGNNGSGMIDTFYCDKIVIAGKSTTPSKGVYCHSLGQFITTTCYVLGANPANLIGIGYHCTDPGSKLTLTTASVWWCNIGLLADNNGFGEIISLDAQYNNIGLQIGPTNTGSKIRANSLYFNESITFDIDVLATNGDIEIFSSFLDNILFNNPNNVNITIRYNANIYGNFCQTMLGNLQIGSIQEPSKVAIGGGEYTYIGLVILSNSNLQSGTWVDNSSVALVANGPPFNLFQSVLTGNCMYIGSDSPIYGCDLNISTATSLITPLGNLIWEYWNGSLWVVFNIMQTCTRNAYMNSFISAVGYYNIRFGLNSTNSSFALLSLNGNNKYWVRTRISVLISSLPLGNSLKIHGNATIINNDGFIEMNGNARVMKNNEISTYLSSGPSSSQQLYFSNNLSILKPNNVFTLGDDIIIGFSFRIPIGIDISMPININIGLVVDNNTAGNISWNLRYVFSTTGVGIYLNPTDVIINPNIITVPKITVIGSDQKEINLNDSISLNISNITPNIPTSNKFYLYGCLERNASGGDVNDTFPGNATLATIDYDYTIYCIGGH